MGKFLNKKYFLTGVIVLAVAAVAFNVFAQTAEWQTISGGGGAEGQSCKDWLVATGQWDGTTGNTRVVHGDAVVTNSEGNCIYRVKAQYMPNGKDTFFIGRNTGGFVDYYSHAEPMEVAGHGSVGWLNEGDKTQVCKSTTCKEPAGPPVVDIFRIVPTSLTMKKGDTANLSAQVLYVSDGGEPRWINLPLSTGIWRGLITKWSSSNSGVAAVVSGGTSFGTTVTATGVGTATVKGEYTVIWLTGASASYSKQVVVTVKPLPPAAPTNLTATYNNQKNNVDLSWNAVSGADGYKVFRAASVYQETARLASGSITSYTDESFTCQTKVTISYKVVAYNAGGDSTASNEVEVSVQSALSPRCAAELFPTCSVSNATPSRGWPVDFRGTDFNITKYKYVWKLGTATPAGCLDDSTICATGPLINDQSYGAYKIEVCDVDTTNCSGSNIKQSVSCPAVDVRIAKLKAEVISR